MRIAVSALALALLATPVLAQSADSVETNLGAQWQAAQTGQQNAAKAIGDLLEAYRKDHAALAVAQDAAKAKDAWWSAYVKGLTSGVAK